MNSFQSFKSQVAVIQNFPNDRIEFEKSFLLFDEKLKSLDNENLQNFIDQFPHQWGAKAGEALKDFRSFPKNLETLLKRWPQPISRSHQLVILGGGSVGDFGGFVASVLKRGVGLIQIPSTWVAAMDSAHGGKNGLNFDTIKNQIGTFYPAQRVFVVKELLEASPVELKEQSYGELIKMALIGDSKFFKEIMMEKRVGSEFIWRFLPHCIEDKYNIILQDPYENKKIRQILNFGHSFGHALEAQFGWPHGDAVLQGVYFSLEWSRHRNLLSTPLCQQIIQTIGERFDRAPATQFNWYKPPSAKSMMKWVQADKKINEEGELLFVFLKNIGKPAVESVSLVDLMAEAKRQNWVK